MSTDFTIRWKRGQGNGGQHRNKTENCCVLTHVPTDTVVTIDGRSRKANLKNALRVMAARLGDMRRRQQSQHKNQLRKEKIAPGGVERVRTYDYSRNVVTDHRTGKKASIKDVVEKGLLNKLR